MADAMNLTPGERLWLWRRHLLTDRARMTGRHHATQWDAARALGVSRTAYALMERDGAEALRAPFSPRPTASDLLALARRRSGLELRQAAAEAGVCHVTYLLWERRADRRLRAFWRARRAPK